MIKNTLLANNSISTADERYKALYKTDHEKCLIVFAFVM